MSAETSTNYSTAMTDADMRLTPAAAGKMAALMTDADDDDISGIRVFVTGGGCGGMAYGMTYAQEVAGYDSTLEGNGYRIVIDAVALNYLKGCEIDFAQDRFMFRNVFQAVGGSGACGGCGGSGY
jgi:iron-sulfur cluster insertion protein